MTQFWLIFAVLIYIVYLYAEINILYLFKNTYEVKYSEGRKGQNKDYHKPYFHLILLLLPHCPACLCWLVCISFSPLKGLNFSSIPDLYNINTALRLQEKTCILSLFSMFSTKEPNCK